MSEHKPLTSEEQSQKYPTDVTQLILGDVKTSFEKHAGFNLTMAEWANLRHALQSSIQGHYIHNRNKREMEMEK